MSEMKHTPGPWTIYDEAESYLAVDALGGCRTIAHINMTDGTEEERRANTQLIAAAPELLEGCKALMARIEDSTLVRNTSDDAYVDWAMRMVTLVIELKQAQAAIAKAEGHGDLCSVCRRPVIDGRWHEHAAE